MKWHKNLYDAILLIISKIEKEKSAPEKLLKWLFSNNPQWGKRDREFIKEKVYDLIRYKNRWEKLSELLFRKSTPENLLTAYILVSEPELPEYLFQFNTFKQSARKYLNELLQKEIYHYGYPQWLLDELKNSHGKKSSEILLHLNKPNKPAIRVNTLKISRNEFARILSRNNYEFALPKDYPHAIVFQKNYRLDNSRWYRNGLFEWQDLASQAVGYFTEAQPDMTVIDTCAGAGGKTLHLSALMKNQGRIIAFDISRAKLKELKKRAGRAGVKNLKEIGLIDKYHIQKYQNAADIVLIDAPCSGSGTLKRKPHLKWKFNKESFEKIIHNQQFILDQYAGMTKHGGLLIYVTCSLIKKENENQIKNFLLRNKDFTFVEEKYILPSEKTDGFYMAKLKRK